MANCIVCTDKDKLIKELTEERNHYRDLYLKAHNTAVRKDYDVQNQKQALLTLRNTLGTLTAENQHLWGLVRIQAAEKNA